MDKKSPENKRENYQSIHPSTRIEKKIQDLENKIDKLLIMVESIHKHVGFVDKLSRVFENLKNQSYGIAQYVSLKLLT